MGRMTPGLQSDVSDLRRVCRDSSCSGRWVTVHVSPALTDSSTPPCTGFQLCHVLPIMGWISHLLLYNKWLQILQPKAIHIYCQSFYGSEIWAQLPGGHSGSAPVRGYSEDVSRPAGSSSARLCLQAHSCGRCCASTDRLPGLFRWVSLQGCLGPWRLAPPRASHPKTEGDRTPTMGVVAFYNWTTSLEFAAFWFVRSSSSNPANTWEEGVTSEPLPCTETGRSLGPCESLPTTWFSPTDLAQGLSSCISSLS